MRIDVCKGSSIRGLKFKRWTLVSLDLYRKNSLNESVKCDAAASVC